MRQFPRMVALVDLPVGAAVWMPTEYYRFEKVYVVSDGTEFRAVVDKPDVKLSCRCKTEWLSKEDCPDWPWLSTGFVCQDCGKTVLVEKVK